MNTPDSGINIPATPEVAKESGEPILTNGVTVAAAVGATVALLDRFGVPVVEGDTTLITAFISLVVIPVGTWFLARRKTVTVDKANAAIKVSSQLRPGTPIRGFSKGTSGESTPL